MNAVCPRSLPRRRRVHERAERANRQHSVPGLSSDEGGFMSEVLRAEHLAKSFGAVTALTDIDLRLEQGEVLGLIGDNGAGKSTLMKILCGFHQPDSGRIVLDGQDVTFKSVEHARTLGIDTVYQDLALINELS